MKTPLKSLAYAALLFVLANDVFAASLPFRFRNPPRTAVPEIDAAAGGSAIALLGGQVVLMKERRKARKPEK